MRRTFSLMVCLVALLSVTTLAQQGPTPAPAAKAADPFLDPTDANVTIEITVVDKAAGSTVTVTRRGTITLANQASGSVRGLRGYYDRNAATKLDPTGIDIDARAYLRKSGMVSVNLTVSYLPSGSEPVMTSAQQQSATLFLKPGLETQVLMTGNIAGQGPAVSITAKAAVVK